MALKIFILLLKNPRPLDPVVIKLGPSLAPSVKFTSVTFSATVTQCLGIAFNRKTQCNQNKGTDHLNHVVQIFFSSINRTEKVQPTCSLFGVFTLGLTKTLFIHLYYIIININIIIIIIIIL